MVNLLLFQFSSLKANIFGTIEIRPDHFRNLLPDTKEGIISVVGKIFKPDVMIVLEECGNSALWPIRSVGILHPWGMLPFQ